MRNEVVDTVREALLVLLILQVPILAGGILAGAISALLQLFTSLRDSTVSYAFQVIACVIIVGGLFAAFSQALMDLMFRSLQ
jgi:flagellar biosynthesis protein FliQ